MKFETEVIAAIAIAVVSLFDVVTLANAQSDAVRQIYAFGATVPTNIEGVHTYPAPPAGFNPLTASDEELATHGFPQRPNKLTDANHYDMWARAMAAAKIRWTGDLKPMPSSGRERMVPSPTAPALRPQPATAGPTQLTSTQWSGVVSTNKLKKWSTKTSFDDVWGEFTVPRIQPPFGVACTYVEVYDWISIDGGASDRGLGGGADLSLICPGIQNMYAAIGWETYDGVFTINPGDIVYLEASNSLGGLNNGTVFIEDLTTLTYNSYSLEAFTPLIGNNVEWLVGTSSGAFELGNTIGIAFEGTEALTVAGKPFFPGSTTAATEVFTMVDSSGQPVEVVSYGGTGTQGKSSLFFQTTGCAYTGGCPAP